MGQNLIHGLRNGKAMTQNKAWMLKACNECRIVWRAALLSLAYVGYTASDEKSCTPFFGNWKLRA